MKKELLEFIRKNELSPFSSAKTLLKSPESIFKTRDGKSVHQKVLSHISRNFVFSETSNLFNMFDFVFDSREIKLRQDFFKEIISLPKTENFFLKYLSTKKASWKPKYDVLVVTEDSATFTKLKEMGCPVRLIISESDVSLLESYDLVQVINCNDFSSAMESLSQAVFLKNIEEVYLERYLEQLSCWKNNLEILKKYDIGVETNQIVNELDLMLELTKEDSSFMLDRDFVEKKVDEINNNVSLKLKDFMISGESLFQLMSKNQIPKEINSMIIEEVQKSKLPFEVLNIGIPVTVDEGELEKEIKRQNAGEFFEFAQKVKNNSSKLKEIPSLLKKLSDSLLLFDFISGISKFLENEMIFPEISENELLVTNSKNILIENPKPISFGLNETYKCSILTGANSGGKTTLLEHIIQIISLSQFGLPLFGEIKIPLFSEIYYFAKNKGSENKGAFETLLNQMSKIKPGDKTLILADEIESVTEPGVAGKIISATVDYFINRKCFLIVATHLGHEIQKNTPEKTRIDGIEAKGLDADFNLIVDHNPVLGRLAHSTPELIVEKLANSEKTEYFIHLNNSLKKETASIKKKEIALVYLVAGISSRFGGKVKAFAKIGPNGETLIEYSMNQALKAGFNKIIFVVSEQIHDLFKQRFNSEYNGIPIEYALQYYDKNFRDKPWGTVDAICSATKLIDSSFVVCNGDDIYGEETFKILFNHLTLYQTSASVGYNLVDVLPDFGTVNRGIFEIDSEHDVKSIEEIFELSKENYSQKGFNEFALCSMNIFAFQKNVLPLLSEILIKFKQINKNRKSECLLPSEISNLINNKNLKMKIYPTREKWYGITYPGDEIIVFGKLFHDSKML